MVGQRLRKPVPTPRGPHPNAQDSAQRHYTYPVLHYFHSAERRSAVPASVTPLHQGLDLLRFGVDPHARLDPSTVEVTSRALESFLKTLPVVASGEAVTLRGL